MRTNRRLMALALVLTAVLAACGQKSNPEEEAKARAAAKAQASEALADLADGKVEGQATGEAAAGSDDVKAADAAASTTAPPAKADTGAASETTPPTLDTKIFEGDFVFGKPQPRSTDDPRPPGCSFKTNELCRFQVAGTYQLKSADVASIHVGAYEDGKDTADFHTTLPQARKGSSRWFVKEFPYQARPGVKQVEFLVKLLDVNGKELARSQPTKFQIAS